MREHTNFELTSINVLIFTSMTSCRHALDPIDDDDCPSRHDGPHHYHHLDAIVSDVSALCWSPCPCVDVICHHSYPGLGTMIDGAVCPCPWIDVGDRGHHCVRTAKRKNEA